MVDDKDKTLLMDNVSFYEGMPLCRIPFPWRFMSPGPSSTYLTPNTHPKYSQNDLQIFVTGSR